VKGLALAGGVAYESGDNAQAIRYWKLARDLTPPGSEFADNLTKGIEQAQAATGSSEPGVPAAMSADATAANGGAGSSANASDTARVTGQVSLSPALVSKTLPTDTVFVFARAAQGPRMPLAIVRRTVADLPISFTLDDTMAMSPEMKLSKFPVVVVGARVSRTGNAMPSPGDLSGQLDSVRTGTEGLKIVIDSVQP
jgi:cytochrome c-type biogenesis protein CcmH